MSEANQPKRMGNLAMNPLQPKVNVGRSEDEVVSLHEYDYSLPGAYFVTVVTENRRRLFGHIIEGRNYLSFAGLLLERIWFELSLKFPTIKQDIIEIMPEHLHYVLFLMADRESDESLSAQSNLCEPALRIRYDGYKQNLQRNNNIPPTDWLTPAYWPSLQDVVGWFNATFIDEYMLGVARFGWPYYPGPLWQPDFFCSIIRTRQSLRRIRWYIAQNPSRYRYR